MGHQPILHPLTHSAKESPISHGSKFFQWFQSTSHGKHTLQSYKKPVPDFPPREAEELRVETSHILKKELSPHPNLTFSQEGNPG